MVCNRTGAIYSKMNTTSRSDFILSPTPHSFTPMDAEICTRSLFPIMIRLLMCIYIYVYVRQICYIVWYLQINCTFHVNCIMSSRSSRTTSRQYTFVIIGDAGAGKTTLMERLCYPTAQFRISTCAPTLAVERHCINRRGSNVVKCVIIDTAGQERYAPLTSVHMKVADCILLCSESGDQFEVTLTSALQKWYGRWVSRKKTVSVILLRLKCDIDAGDASYPKIYYGREKEALCDYLKNNLTRKSKNLLNDMQLEVYMEVSAHHDINVDQLRSFMLDMVVKYKEKSLASHYQRCDTKVKNRFYRQNKQDDSVKKYTLERNNGTRERLSKHDTGVVKITRKVSDESDEEVANHSRCSC